MLPAASRSTLVYVLVESIGFALTMTLVYTNLYGVSFWMKFLIVGQIQLILSVAIGMVGGLLMSHSQIHYNPLWRLIIFGAYIFVVLWSVKHFTHQLTVNSTLLSVSLGLFILIIGHVVEVLVRWRFAPKVVGS